MVQNRSDFMLSLTIVPRSRLVTPYPDDPKSLLHSFSRADAPNVPDANSFCPHANILLPSRRLKPVFHGEVWRSRSQAYAPHDIGGLLFNTPTEGLLTTRTSRPFRAQVSYTEIHREHFTFRWPSDHFSFPRPANPPIVSAFCPHPL